MNRGKSLSSDTLLIHGDRSHDADASLTPPIPWSATFVARDADQFSEMSSRPMHPAFYTRYGNPLHARVANLLAQLEGAELGLMFASGMGAISSTLIGLLKKGDRVVAQRNHYMGTTRLLTETLNRFGIETSFVDQTSLSAFETAFERPCALVMLESPTNPDCSLTDLAAVCRTARAAGALSVVDNTFAGPLNQQPLQLGADLVVHSATKSLGGHHDLTAGAVLGSQSLIERIWQTQIVLGATLSPMDAWLLLRGLRTLAVRTDRTNRHALRVALALEQHPAVASVSYPGLPSHPQHELAQRQMSGYGSVLGVRLKAGYDGTAAFVSALTLARQAVSLGGVDTLIVHAASMWAGTLDEAGLRAAGIEPNLVRLSVGLEDVDDLIADLTQALDGLKM